MRRLFYRIAVVGILLLAAPGVMAGPDNGIYGELLRKYVRNGVVDYAGFKKDESRLDAYLKELEETDLKRLSRNETFAFYINAYNAWTIKLILSKYPGVESIKDLGSFLQSPWKKKIVRAGGKVLSLDDVEHGILRPTFRDPRIHFAVNCASKSCPPLLSEPFTGERLDAQLDRATRDFINNPVRNFLKGDRLYVSRIFKWYGEDFPQGVPSFFVEYAEERLKSRILALGDAIRVEYLDYDWSLNGK